MPPRISRGSLPSKAKAPKTQASGGGGRARAPKKSAKRALNAFAIASHDAPDRNKIRKNRLGESDVDARKKRPREDEDEEEDEEEDGADVKRRKQARGGNDSYDEGSDSEGNNWKMGHVDDDNDSDIDSDEAFGESDEERFEGWTFRGSQSNQKGGKPKKRAKEVEMGDADEDFDLDEEDSGDEEEDEDDLGEDAIDLATALDQYEESEEEEKEKKSKKSKKKKKISFDDSDESPSEPDDIGADGASDFSSSGDEDDEDEEDRQAQLKDLISSLEAEEEQKQTTRGAEIHESSAPSEFGVSRKVDLASFKSKVADPERKKALKLLQDDKPSTKRNDLSRKLDAPLPKRQQDKIDREAANAKAEETLARWNDTVKHNRQAEHLHFPLNQAGEGTRMGESRLLATTTAAPTNELESTIQSILQQSGLSNGHEDEEKLQKWETLQTNKLPIEEVMKRRAQLRMERELLFREEVRAKRVKKIKSKAYRRVHRKERERLMERERDALKADGVDISEDEREYNDRRRAEERMGSKHRDSKWAKGVKASGKAAWDEDARSGVTELARRNEELRRRIEGKDVQDEDEDASDLSSEDEDEDMDDDEDDDGTQVLQRQLGRLKENPFSTKESKLGSMAFMQKAEKARKAQNDEDIERVRKELAGEDSDAEGSDEDETLTKAGRRKFGPDSNKITPAIQIRKSEFEERAPSDSENEDGVANEQESTTDRHRLARPASKNKKSTTTRPSKTVAATKAPVDESDDDEQMDNPYLVKAKKSKKTSSDQQQPSTTTLTTSKPAAQPKKPKKSTSTQQPDHGLAGNPTLSAPDTDGFQTVTYSASSDADAFDSDEGMDLDILNPNHALTASAFASDAAFVESEFAAEKALADLPSDSETKTTDQLPGWGSWAGSNLPSSKKKSRRPPPAPSSSAKNALTRPNKPTTTTSKKAKSSNPNRGIVPQQPDNDKVLLTQRRQKANTKFLAPQLPFPFESKEQYERGLRMPLGSEWTTKQSHQKNTLPRVLVKGGTVIGALGKPTI